MYLGLQFSFYTILQLPGASDSKEIHAGSALFRGNGHSTKLIRTPFTTSSGKHSITSSHRWITQLVAKYSGLGTTLTIGLIS